MAESPPPAAPQDLEGLAVLLPNSNDPVTLSCLEKQQAALVQLSDALRRVSHFNSESSRLIPGLLTAMNNHAKDLAALQKRVALLESKATSCRARSLRLAAAHGVDVAALALHDPDQVPDHDGVRVAPQSAESEPTVATPAEEGQTEGTP